MNKTHTLVSFQDKKRYLMNQIVIIIKVYSQFGLSKIRYYDDSEEFIVDSKLLEDEPSAEHTINIQLLGGKTL